MLADRQKHTDRHGQTRSSQYSARLTPITGGLIAMNTCRCKDFAKSRVLSVCRWWRRTAAWRRCTAEHRSNCPTSTFHRDAPAPATSSVRPTTNDSSELYRVLRPTHDDVYKHIGWRRGVVVSGVRRTNEVNPRRARLVPRWVTVLGRVHHLGM